MIVPLPRRQPSTDENVLPLINIVFLLLIFFMLAGAVSVTAPFPVDPPETRAAEATGAPRSGLAIAGDGRLAFGGDEIELDDIESVVADWREAAADDDVLAVRADSAASSSRLLEVLAALRAADVDEIRLLSTGASGDG